MPNKKDGAYGLTLMCPIKNGQLDGSSFSSLTRDYLQEIDLKEISPLAKVPNTFLCRFYILNDVFFENLPAKEDHLKSRYLVFSSNFHGSLEAYIEGFWQHAEEEARNIWRHCVAFDKVNDAQSFIAYIKKCQVETTFYFNGSSGEPLAEQLKGLYLKQEFTNFVVENQGASPEALKAAFDEFVERAQPSNLAGPTWEPGKFELSTNE